MAQANGSRFKLVYKNWHSVDRHSFPMPNGIHDSYVNYLRSLADQKGEMIILNQYRSHDEIDSTFQQPGSANLFRHSNFIGYFIRFYTRDMLVSEEQVDLNDDYYYLYPVELEFSNYRFVAEGTDIIVNGQQVKYGFEETLSPLLLNLIKQNKVKIIFSNIVDPCGPYHYFQLIEERLANVGINSNSIIYIQGSCPSQFYNSQRKFQSIYLNSILSLSQANENYRKFPCMTSLGYISDVVKPQDLDRNKLRPKKFLCFNRSMNRAHRLAIAAMAIKYDLLKDSTFSFLANLNVDTAYTDLKNFYTYDDNLEEVYKKIVSIVPYEIDTHHLSPAEKQSFQNVDVNKKELYENSYVHIVSETLCNTDLDSFMSEKTWRPILNLQPFVYIGNYNALARLKHLGFKTFHPYIDETYDEIRDPTERFQAIEKEILKLNAMSIEELHKWYYDITDIVIHNQEHLAGMTDYNPLEQLKQLEQLWN